MSAPDPQVQAAIEQFVAAHRGDPLGKVAQEVIFENERVRVWSLDLAPGEASDLHRHECDYLVVVLEGDRAAGVPLPGSGTPLQVVDVVPGTTAYLPRGGTEWALNVGTRRYREILIELKDPQ